MAGQRQPIELVLANGKKHLTNVATATIMIADENLDAVEGYKEYIRHDTVASAPVEEPTEEPVGEPTE